MRITADMVKRRFVQVLFCLSLLTPSLALILSPDTPALAAPDRLLWSTIRTPSDEDFMVVTPSEVNVLVPASDSVWYAADIPNLVLYKSEDGGLTWEDEILDALLDAEPAPVLPVWDLAVAPDDPDFVVAVTDGRQEVYVSDDGGETWDYASSGAGWLPTELIADVCVSGAYDGVRDIAVGTRVAASGVPYGDVWVVTEGVWGAWSEQELDKDVSTVRFSPGYDVDETIVAIGSDDTGTFVCTGYRNTETNTTNWTDPTDPDFVDVSELDEDSPTEDEIIFSDLVFYDGYSGDISADRNLLVSYASEADTDDVYRVENTDVRRLDVDRGSKLAIMSIAYHGGLLLAGEVAAKGEDAEALLHFCDNPTESYPDWWEPWKPPSAGYGSGSGNAIVAFSPDGSWAYCGTSSNSVTTAAGWYDTTIPGGTWDGVALDESAVSRSSAGENYGAWNQISLIDTDMANLCDYSLWLVGETPEDDPGNVLYVASVGAGMDSIWRTRAAEEEGLGQRWERVDYIDSLTDDIIMRRTPEDSPEDAVFYAVRGSNFAYKSLDEGQRWERVRDCPDITDFAVVSSERIYVLDDFELNIAQWTKIRRWYVWDWTREIDTGLKSGHTIGFHGSYYIFVGDNGDEGKIASSTDGGETFELLQALPEPGPVQMAVDQEFARNKLLYAATEVGTSGMYRWTIGGSAEWDSLHPPDNGFSGLAHTAGVLYGAFGHGADRTLVSRANTVGVIDWDRLTVGLSAGVDFRAGTLRTTVNDAVNLWAVDGQAYDYEAEQGCLWVYSDTFALPTPWPVSPAIGEVLDCDPCACDSCPFCFHWKELPKAEIYELWVAMDEQFKFVLLEVDQIDPVCCDAPGVCYFEIPFIFGCGETYYWRVRATGTTEGEEVHTRWSPSMRFIVAAATTVEKMHVAPLPDAPEPGAQGVSRTPGFSWNGFPPTTEYQFLLAEDNEFTLVIERQELDRTACVYPGELDWGKTYFWRVRALKPAPSEWSVASFTVMGEPQTLPPGPSPVLDLASGVPPSATPQWIWLVIGLLGMLNVLIVVWIVTRRR